MGSNQKTSLLRAAFHSNLLDEKDFQKMKAFLARSRRQGSPKSEAEILRQMGMTKAHYQRLAMLLRRGYHFCSPCHKIFSQIRSFSCPSCESPLQKFSPSTSSDQPSFKIKSPGKYESLKMLGRGGYGAVYRVKDPMSERSVALKVLHKRHNTNLKVRKRFLREIRVTSILEHPGIIPLYESGNLEDGSYYFTMKELGSETLKDWLAPGPQGERKHSLDFLVEVLLKICQALEYSHSKGVIHRDLKPDNIAVDRYGEVIVMDWGIARIQGERDLDGEEDSPGEGLNREGDESLTMGGMMGTPGYMSPEQIRGEEVDGRADIFSLGAILYKVLTSALPFPGNRDQRLYKTMKEAPLPPEKRSPEREIPPELSAIALKALEKETSRRYQSVKEMREDLERYRGGFAIRARRESLWQRARKWAVRNGVYLAGAGVLFLLVVATWLAVHLWQKSEKSKKIKDLFQKAQKVHPSLSEEKLSRLYQGPNQDQNHPSSRRQKVIDGLLRARESLEEAYEIAPANREIRSRLVKVENQIGRLALAERNFLMSRTSLDRITELGAEKVARKLEEAIETAEGAVEKRHRQKIEKIMAQLAEGPPPAGMADEYVTEIVALASVYAVKELLKYVDHEKFWPRKVAIEALGKLGDNQTEWKGKDAVESLMARLKKLNLEKDRQEILALVWALGRLKDPRAGELVWSLRGKTVPGSPFWNQTKIPASWIPAGGKKEPQGDLSTLMKRAVARAQGQKWKAAIGDFSKILAQKPDSIKALEKRGQSYLRIKKYQRALADARQILEIDPANPTGYNLQGLIYHEMGKYQKALQIYNRALKLNSDEPLGYFNRGLVYHDLKEYQKAAHDFQKALKWEPENIKFLRELAKSYRLLGQYKKALEAYSKIIELNPKEAKAYAERGYVYVKLGKLDRAEADLDKGEEIKPRLVTIYGNRYFLHLARGDYSRAMGSVNRALELDPQDSALYVNRGILHYKRKKYDRALQDFNRALKLNPRNSVALESRASLHFARGNKRAALKDINRALQVNPRRGESYEKKISFLEKMNRQGEVLEVCNKGLKYLPHHLGMLSRRINLSYIKGDYPQALEDLKLYLKIKPGDLDAREVRSTIYIVRQEYDKALADLNKLIQRLPKTARLYQNRGEAYRRQKKYRLALRDFNRAHQLKPNHLEFLTSRGGTLYALGKYKRALADLNKVLTLKPNHSLALLWRAKTFRALGKRKKALRDGRKFLEDHSHNNQAPVARQLVKELEGGK